MSRPLQPALHHRQASFRSLLCSHSSSPLDRPHLSLSPPPPCPTPCAVYRCPVPLPAQSSLFPHRAPYPVRSLPHPQPRTPRPGPVPSTLESLLPTPSLPWLGRSPKPCRAPPDTLVRDPSPLWPLMAHSLLPRLADPTHSPSDWTPVALRRRPVDLTPVRQATVFPLVSVPASPS